MGLIIFANIYDSSSGKGRFVFSTKPFKKKHKYLTHFRIPESNGKCTRTVFGGLFNSISYVLGPLAYE